VTGSRALTLRAVGGALLLAVVSGYGSLRSPNWGSTPAPAFGLASQRALSETCRRGCEDMTRDERKKAVLELWDTEPEPSKSGENVGTRSHEGVDFQRRMVALLSCEGVEVDTALAKSSDGQKLDGNASERITYKMLRFKKNPLNRDRVLVIALNSAFENYDNPQLTELREQAGYLNGIDGRGQIVVLSRPHRYRDFIDQKFPAD
jgi:hypothetical protein